MVSWVTFFMGITLGMILLAVTIGPTANVETERTTVSAPLIAVEIPDWIPTLDALKYLFSAMILTVTAMYWLLL